MTREDTLTAAVRHFEECEQRRVRQQKRVELLEQGTRPDLTKEARGVLKLLEEALHLARERLQTERRARGLSN